MHKLDYVGAGLEGSLQLGIGGWGERLPHGAVVPLPVHAEYGGVDEIDKDEEGECERNITRIHRKTLTCCWA